MTGILIAWWNEKTGGIIITIAAAALCIFAYIDAGHHKIFAMLTSGFPFLISGILFLIGWWILKKSNTINIKPLGNRSGVLILIVRILKNRNFIFILAFILGLSVGNYIGWVRHLTLPALSIVMTVSMTQIPLRSFLPLKSFIKPVFLTILLNYFVFAAVMLTMAWFIIPEKELWIGFVIIAFAPPGVAIPPFTSILGGDVKFSLIGIIGAYIAAIIIIPSPTGSTACWW